MSDDQRVAELNNLVQTLRQQIAGLERRAIKAETRLMRSRAAWVELHAALDEPGGRVK